MAKAPPGVSLLDIQGNAHADTLANKAACKACVPLHVSTKYLFYVNLAKDIQHRLATILINLPGRHKVAQEKTEKQTKPDLTSLLASTSHLVCITSGTLSCSRCHSSFKSDDPSLKHWLTCTCSEAGSSQDRPAPLHDEVIHRGTNTTHSTHSLQQYRGLVYCRKCGSRGGANQLRKLSRPCTPPTAYGKQVLCAISEGRLPPNLSQWPS